MLRIRLRWRRRFWSLAPSKNPGHCLSPKLLPRCSMRIAAIPPSVVVLLASAVAGAQTAATPAPSSPPAQPAASAPAQPPAPAPSAAAGLKPETAATADLQFEVATIKPSDPAE